MKKHSIFTIFIGVLLCVLSLVNVYRFAGKTEAGNAVWATISGICGGIIVVTSTNPRRVRPPENKR